MRRSVNIALALSPLVLLLLLVGCGAGSSTQQSRPSPTHPFSVEQRQAFTVLRGTTRPVPSILRRHLRRARNSEVRTLWLDTAIYVPTHSGLWIVNGHNMTCIVQTHGGAVSCEPRITVLREGVSLGTVRLGPPPRRAAREFTVVGIVPNGIARVELKVGGETRNVAVHDNAFSLSAAVPIVVAHPDRRAPGSGQPPRRGQGGGSS
jgi:hypothetical protein